MYWREKQYEKEPAGETLPAKTQQMDDPEEEILWQEEAKAEDTTVVLGDEGSDTNVITSTGLAFKGGNESGAPAITSLESGKEGYLFASIGFANNETHVVQSRVVIDLGVTNLQLPDFSNGTYTADKVTYRLIEESDGHKYIEVATDNLTINGGTLSMRFRVKYPQGISDSSDSVNAILKVDGNVKKEASLACEAKVQWNHDKSVDQASIVLVTDQASGNRKLNNDLTYTIREFSDSGEEGVIRVNSYTITDTLMFPAGMYVDKGTPVESVLTCSEGMSAEPVVKGDRITGYKIIHTSQAASGEQVGPQNYTVTLKKDSIQFDDSFTPDADTKVSNQLHTDYVTVKGVNGSIEGDASAETLVKSPGTIDFELFVKNGDGTDTKVNGAEWTSAENTTFDFGSILEDGTIYAANFTKGNSAKIEEADDSKTILFENEFYKLPTGYYKSGELVITKKLLGADGKPNKSTDVFYAGIFKDASYTALADMVDTNVVELALHGKAEASTYVQVMVDPGKKVTLYVTETDAEGNPVAGADSFGYEVTVSETSVTIDEQNNSASVIITNQEKEETEEQTVDSYQLQIVTSGYQE